MKEEDIADLGRKYNKKDPEQDKRARAELERTNSESELLALTVMEDNVWNYENNGISILNGHFG